MLNTGHLKEIILSTAQNVALDVHPTILLYIENLQLL